MIRALNANNTPIDVQHYAMLKKFDWNVVQSLADGESDMLFRDGHEEVGYFSTRVMGCRLGDPMRLSHLGKRNNSNNNYTYLYNNSYINFCFWKQEVFVWFDVGVSRNHLAEISSGGQVFQEAHHPSPWRWHLSAASPSVELGHKLVDLTGGESVMTPGVILRFSRLSRNWMRHFQSCKRAKFTLPDYVGLCGTFFLPFLSPQKKERIQHK
jgi:hypothetical protein